MYFRLKTGSFLSLFQIDISFLLDVSSLSRAHEDLSISVHASWYGSVCKEAADTKDRRHSGDGFKGSMAPCFDNCL